MEKNLEEGGILLKILLFILVTLVVGASFIYFSRSSVDAHKSSEISVTSSSSSTSK